VQLLRDLKPDVNERRKKRRKELEEVFMERAKALFNIGGSRRGGEAVLSSFLLSLSIWVSILRVNGFRRRWIISATPGMPSRIVVLTIPDLLTGTYLGVAPDLRAWR
jgi:hypothetical protein